MYGKEQKAVFTCLHNTTFPRQWRNKHPKRFKEKKKNSYKHLYLNKLSSMRAKKVILWYASFQKVSCPGVLVWKTLKWFRIKKSKILKEWCKRTCTVFLTSPGFLSLIQLKMWYQVNSEILENLNPQWFPNLSSFSFVTYLNMNVYLQICTCQFT